MYDITILIPSIRTGRLLNLYESCKTACKNHTWQLLIIGPFLPPEELLAQNNVKFIQDYGNVVRCVQRAVPECDAPIFFLTVDDCTFTEDSIDMGIRLYKTACTEKDVVCMRYGEGGDKQAAHYWTTNFHGDLRKPGIDPSWKIANQPLMSVHRWCELGGLDCVSGFEYLDKPIHDLIFRHQYDNGQVVISNFHCCIATWYPGTKADHAAVHFAQVDNDTGIFDRIYAQPVGSRQVYMKYDDWKNIPEIWQRRFGQNKPKSYKEMCEQQGYEHLNENG